MLCIQRVIPAGIHANKLEDMERRLRNDMAQEAAAWGGRVMLHAEMPPTTTAAASPDSQNGGHHATMERAMSRVASGPVMDKSPFSMAERQSDGAPDHLDGGAGADGAADAGAGIRDVCFPVCLFR